MGLSKALFDLFQIVIYGDVCNICFAKLSIHEQKAKPKNNGIKYLIDKVL
jgi:hypothetical protein